MEHISTALNSASKKIETFSMETDNTEMSMNQRLWKCDQCLAEFTGKPVGISEKAYRWTLEGVNFVGDYNCFCSEACMVKHQEARRKEKQIDRMAESDSRLAQMGVPQRALSVAIHYPAKNIQIDRVLKNGSYVHGTEGTGKTVFAADVCYRLWVEYGTKIKWWSSVELAIALRNPDEYDQIIHDCVDAEFLVIDDFGVEKISEHLQAAYFAIIDGRYNALKPTFYTSNYSLQDIDERIGKRVSARIYESVGGKDGVSAMNGYSKRIRKAG